MTLQLTASTLFTLVEVLIPLVLVVDQRGGTFWIDQSHGWGLAYIIYSLEVVLLKNETSG